MKQRKNGLPDRRFRSSKSFEAREFMFWQKYGVYICVGILGALAGMILTKTLWDMSHPKALLSPLGQKVVPHMVVVKADEVDCDADPLTYIRCRGQELGYDDFTISQFIRIARAESGFKLNPMARNPNSTATGIYQFISGTFHRYCKGGNVYNFVDNIDCFYKVLEVDGYPRGLRHWDASKGVWGK